jgi:hypothetical protein
MRNEKAEPDINPSVKKNTIIVPASSALRVETSVGPSIIARVDKYPFDKANAIMKRIGKASDWNKTGSRVPSTLQSRKSGQNTARIKTAIHTVFAVSPSVVTPASNLPKKSKALKSRKKKGMNKSLLKRVASLSHCFSDLIRTVIAGNMDNVTAKVK